MLREPPKKHNMSVRLDSEELSKGQQNEEETKVLTWRQDIYVLTIITLAVIVSYWPNWIIRLGLVDNYIANNNYLLLFLFYLQFFLMLACPFLSKRIAPELCGFNMKKWFQGTTSETAWYVLFPLIVIITSAITARLVEQFGLPVSKPTDFFSRFHNSISHLIIITCLIAFIGPTIEELFWRGFIQKCLWKVFGPELALFVQAYLWAMLHFYPFGHFVNVLVLGFIFGFWRMRRKTLLPIIIAHVVFNSLICVARLVFWNYL